jgi:signal transduction histidine kinase
VTRAPELPEDLDRILHDLRGPLNAIAMHLEVVKRAIPHELPAKQSVDTVQQELERLAVMLPNAFQVVALEAAEPRPIDVRALVESVIEERELSGVTLASGPWPCAFGDPRLLALAVEHLLRNALEATPKDAPRPPHVSAQATADGVVLSVRNWGATLPSSNPKVLIRLGARRKPGHHGVGLVTVERIARLLGGALRFETPADGAEVRLILRRAELRG